MDLVVGEGILIEPMAFQQYSGNLHPEYVSFRLLSLKDNPYPAPSMLERTEPMIMFMLLIQGTASGECLTSFYFVQGEGSSGNH